MIIQNVKSSQIKAHFKTVNAESYGPIDDMFFKQIRRFGLSFNSSHK